MELDDTRAARARIQHMKTAADAAVRAIVILAQDLGHALNRCGACGGDAIPCAECDATIRRAQIIANELRAVGVDYDALVH